MKEIRLGSVLIKNRHKRGITQDELAAYLGVSKAAVSKWETAMTYPDITLLPRLAAYFNISIDELMGYEPQMDKMEIRKCYLQFAEEFSMLSFLVMLLVLEAETMFFLGKFLVPGINWLIILLLIAPSISLMAITLIVRGSAKAQGVEEAQQGAVFLVLPLILLATGQFMGVLLINVWISLVLGGICALAAVFLLKKFMGRFTYELLLK